MTLHASLRKSAATSPDQPWLRFGDAAWSYAQGDALTDKIARGLIAQGVQPGDRVALLFTNSPDLVFCYYACFKIGAVTVPLNTRFQVTELVYAINHSGAKILIGQADLVAPLLGAREQLTDLERIFVAGDGLPNTKSFSALVHDAPMDLPTVADYALAALLYTSGTTARPKGVMHSHATLGQQNANYLAVLGADVHARTLISLPMCHIAGFSIFLLSATAAGGTITLLPRFEPEAVLRTIGQNRITYAGGLPVMINALVNHPGAEKFDLSSLRQFISGGDCLPMELQNRFRQLFGVTIDELCGMTEIIYCNQPVNLGQRRSGSIGKPFGDIRIRLEDADGNEVPDGEIGEIVIHSGAVTLGYWNDPENTATVLHDGGMHSGDLARRDEDGFLWFTGRAKDIIIRGGSNIAPGEVEDVLYTHPAVYEAGVVGVPCREFGQRVRAYVALKPGADASGRDLMDWAARSIAAYKVPESIVFMAALPKGPTGKVLRKTLRDQAAVSAMEPA
jgi:long-chain acyl-CoA synthetase